MKTSGFVAVDCRGDSRRREADATGTGTGIDRELVVDVGEEERRREIENQPSTRQSSQVQGEGCRDANAEQPRNERKDDLGSRCFS